MSTWRKIARTGTMKPPPAIPSIPPSALAPSDTANSHSANPLSISSISRSRCRCCASCQSSHEPDLIAAVIELLVINRPLTCAVRLPLDQEHRTANTDTERPSHFSIRRYGFEPVFRFHQWRVVLLFE